MTKTEHYDTDKKKKNKIHGLVWTDLMFPICVLDILLCSA